MLIKVGFVNFFVACFGYQMKSRCAFGNKSVNVAEKVNMLLKWESGEGEGALVEKMNLAREKPARLQKQELLFIICSKFQN